MCREQLQLVTKKYNMWYKNTHGIKMTITRGPQHEVNALVHPNASL